MNGGTAMPRATTVQRVSMISGLIIGIGVLAVGASVVWRSNLLERFEGPPGLPAYAQPLEATGLGARFESCDSQADWFVKGGRITYFGTNRSFQDATAPAIAELDRRGWVVQRDPADPDDSFFARRGVVSISMRRVSPQGVRLTRPVDTSTYDTLISAYVVNNDRCTG